MSPPPFVPPPAYGISKRDFLGKPAPPGYVAGIGRGATGFTTRSDIGPAREAAIAAGPSRQQGTKRKAEDDDDDNEDLNETNYDEFAGYGGSLFNKDPYEEDDEEADKIYETIDKRLSERGKAQKEAKIRQELDEFRQKKPKIQQQFIDLKESLRQVSDEEWVNIPDVGDARNRKQRVARQDKFTPVPDSLLAHQANIAMGGEKLVYLDPKKTSQDDDDMAEMPALREIDEKKMLQLNDSKNLSLEDQNDLRSSYLSQQLSRASGSLASNEKEASNELRNYLTNLESQAPTYISDSTTLEEYRKLFKTLRSTNPGLDAAWIASVRLEEAAGQLKKARSLILAALENCPKKVDLWLEAIRLHSPDVSKALMVKALKEEPRSEKLWIRAAEMESSDDAKRRVYEKARQVVPKSKLLWKKSIELESHDRAHLLLREAVECCPEAVELWLALARLERSEEEAKQVLVRASERHPTERAIWIEAAKLQEQVGNCELVGSIIKRSIEELSTRGVEIKRSEWLREAVDADRASYKLTCREIIRHVLPLDLKTRTSDTCLELWLADVQAFIEQNSISAARAVFSCIVDDKELCKRESVWQQYAKLEMEHGDEEQLTRLLKQAVEAQNCRRSELLWLMLANSMRQKGANLDECRQILAQALEANPDGERIVLAAVDLECANGNHSEARRILADACRSAQTGQLVMRAVELELEQGKLDEAQSRLKKAVQEYKNWPQFYLSLGELEEKRRGDKERAKQWYSDGLKFNPTSVELWISLASLEERTGSIARARSRLEMARLRNPRNVQLYLESVLLECRHLSNRLAGSSGAAVAAALRASPVPGLLARGIKECKDCQEADKLLELQVEIGKGKLPKVEKN